MHHDIEIGDIDVCDVECDIESLHLVDLAQCFDLNIFPCPAEKVYPFREVHGKKQYLRPIATHKNYEYFKAVKKTRHRVSLKERFGPEIASRVMNRYNAFDFEFQTLCWGNRFLNIEDYEEKCKKVWTFTFVEFAFYYTERAGQPELAVISSFKAFMRDLEAELNDLSKRKEIALHQWRAFNCLALNFATNWEYCNKNGSPLDLLR